jgi:hypothetical protein
MRVLFLFNIMFQKKRPTLVGRFFVLLFLKLDAVGFDLSM